MIEFSGFSWVFDFLDLKNYFSFGGLPIIQVNLSLIHEIMLFIRKKHIWKVCFDFINNEYVVVGIPNIVIICNHTDYEYKNIRLRTDYDEYWIQFLPSLCISLQSVLNKHLTLSIIFSIPDEDFSNFPKPYYRFTSYIV